MSVLQSQLRLTVDDRVSARMKAISAQMAAFSTRMRAMTAPLTGTVAKLAAFGAGYVGATAGIRGTAGAAIKFEEAFADVVKVLDATPAQLQEVRHQILEMSKVLPNSAEGIASIYAAAAQSNIPLKELGKFSEMVAKVAVAWDVSESETSDALAKIKNQLNLNVDQIGLYADAINQLGNNTAAKAPNLVDFSKRVAANGEMFGFSATQTLAFGGAMVASGAQTEVAATSFRNMGRALTMGARATKQQGIAFKRLGLDSVKTAKNMQKNALETTLDVLDRIGSLPEWERISIASALFGDEARALMPVIANTTELRRQLGLVANEADYAGSAYNEYLVRASTTGNALAIIGNKIKAVGIEIGDGMLPSIKSLGLGIGDVLDTLKSRYGIIDDINVAFNSLMTGLGYNGPDGLRAMVNDIGDFLFGEAFDNKDGTLIDERATALAKLSNQFRDFGRSIREFGEAVNDNPVTKFLAEMAGHGFKFMLATVGIGLLAGAIMKLGRAMWFLSGAGAAIAILKSLAGVGGALFKTPGLPGGGKPPASVRKLPTPASGALLAFLGKLSPFVAAMLTSGSSADNAYTSADAETRAQMRRDAQIDAATINGDYNRSGPRNGRRGRFLGDAERDAALDAYLKGPPLPPTTLPKLNVPTGDIFQQFLDGMRNQSPERDPMPTLESIRDAVGQAPSGTTQVREVNPTPVHAPINVTVYATTNASADEIGAAVGARVQSAVQSSYSDGGGGGW